MHLTLLSALSVCRRRWRAKRQGLPKERRKRATRRRARSLARRRLTPLPRIGTSPRSKDSHLPLTSSPPLPSASLTSSPSHPPPVRSPSLPSLPCPLPVLLLHFSYALPHPLLPSLCELQRQPLALSWRFHSLHTRRSGATLSPRSSIAPTVGAASSSLSTR